MTPTDIKIATFSDPGFAGRPGLNQELFDTADVFAAWCNDRGGINGRKITVDKKDAALTQVQAKMVEACADDFMMVGGGAVFDQDGVETRLKCLMPDIAGYAVSPENRGSDLLVQPVPNSVKEIPIGDLKWLEGKFPKGARRSTACSPATSRPPASSATSTTRPRKALGWKQVYKDVYPATGASDWTPYAEALRSAGVEGLIWVGEPENLAKLVVAMNNIGYKPDFIRTDANHYDEKLIDQAGCGAQGQRLRPQHLRAVREREEGLGDGPVPGGVQGLQAGRQEPDLPRAAGLVGLAALRPVGEGVRQRPDPQVRVRQRQEGQSAWTGGGLHAETDPKTGGTQDCFALEQATPNGFVLAKIKPTDGIFKCDAPRASTS